MTTIDRLDVELIARLTENARAGVADLAADLGVSRTTIHLRLRRLEDEGPVANGVRARTPLLGRRVLHAWQPMPAR